MRRALAADAGDEERVARVHPGGESAWLTSALKPVAVARRSRGARCACELHVVGRPEHRAHPRARRDRRHRQRRQRHERGYRRAGGDLAVGQRAIPVVATPAVRHQRRARLEHVVRCATAPTCPARSADRSGSGRSSRPPSGSVAAAVIRHVQRVAGAGADHLAVAIVARVAVRRVQPLVRVLMVHVRDVRPGMEDPELHMVADVAVVDVRRIVGEERLGRDLVGRRIGLVRRDVHHHRGIAGRPGAQEELLELARIALRRRPHAQAVRPHLRTDPSRAVVDGEHVASRRERRKHAAEPGHERVKRLRDDEVVVIVNRELSIRLPPVGIRGIGIERRAATRERSGVGSRDDGGQSRCRRSRSWRSASSGPACHPIPSPRS